MKAASPHCSASRWLLQTFAISAAIIVTFCRSHASPLEEWNLVAPGPYLGTAAGDGFVVSLHSMLPDGEIVAWRQDDPTHRWTFGFSGRAHSIVYGEGRFVAATANALLTSSNVVDWSSAPFVASTLAYGNGIFMASGYNTLVRSTDGFNWTPVTSPITNSAYRMNFLGETFIFWARDGAYLSADGINWSPAPAGTQVFTQEKIAYGDGKYVAINSRNVLTSTDGLNWTIVGTLDVLRASIAWGNGLFVAVGGGARAYSRDGISWQVVPNDITSYNITFAYGRFLSGAFGGLYQSTPVVNVELEPVGTLTVSGAPEKTYRIESVDRLANGNWEPQHTFVMPALAQSYDWSDPRSKTGQARFYRVIQTP